MRSSACVCVHLRASACVLARLHASTCVHVRCVRVRKYIYVCIRVRASRSACECLRPRACICVCVRSSACKRLKVRTRLDANGSLRLDASFVQGLSGCTIYPDGRFPCEENLEASLTEPLVEELPALGGDTTTRRS